MMVDIVDGIIQIIRYAKFVHIQISQKLNNMNRHNMIYGMAEKYAKIVRY